MKPSTKKLAEMANNTSNFKDEIVYRGFVQDQAPDDAYEFDERWVQISPLGTWYGSSTTGEPIREDLTPDALESLVQDFHANARQVPLDKDHNSAKAPLERDTEAFAWVDDLKLMSGGATAFNGLYAKFKWRPEGVDLVKSRAYRFLSPVFQLDEENKPRRLISVALTNFPAFDTMPPVYNTTARPTSEDKETDMEHAIDLDALRDQIVEECMKRISIVQSEDSASTETDTETATTEETTETKETTERSESANASSEPVNTEPATAETPATEPAPAPAATEAANTAQPVEQPVEESSKEEVIKPEALNSAAETAPTVTGAMAKMDEWRNLKGEELMRWCRRNPGYLA